MDIEVIIKRTLVFAGLLLMVMAVVATVTSVTQGYLSVYFSMSPTFSMILAGLLIIAVYDPTRKFLIETTDRYLFQKKFNYHKLLKENSQQIAFLHSLDELAKQVVGFLIKQGRVKNAALLTNEDDGFFHLRYPLGYGGRAKRPRFNIEETHPIVDLLMKRQIPLVLEEVEKEMRQVESRKSKVESKENGDSPRVDSLVEVVKLMKQLKAEVLIPSFLRTPEDQEAGSRMQEAGAQAGAGAGVLRTVLVLGQKKSDESYSEEDLDVFFTIAQDSAIAAENARLIDVVVNERESKLRAEKEAEMVNYAKTIAHEIKNALVGVTNTAVNIKRFYLTDLNKIYTSAFKDKGAPPVMEKKYLDVLGKIEHATDVIQSSGEKIRVIAKTAEGTLKSDQTAREELYFRIIWDSAKQDSRADDVHYSSNTPDNFVIFGNLVLLQRVFVNLIVNANEAMNEHGQREKKIHLNGFYKEVDGQKTACFEFQDNGPGIPAAVQEKIFLQGFSTKPKPKKGDMNASGYGQGLFVIKKTIEDFHKGKLTLESEPGKGTKFMFWLPME